MWVIADPLIPLVAAASVGGAAAIPTLSAWGAILMTALLAMLGLRHASAALIQP
nr:IPTL-CTERM sorting domain-containing protein [Delftia acidovorans]